MAVDKPIIVVVHGTSKQGTSVVISLLQTNKFVVKAITRDASSDNAKQLAAKGAEMVEADASDAAQLRAAFEGAYGVFAVTVAMAYGGTEGLYERELATGKMMADAAAAAGVKVFVFSTLEDVDKRTQGKWFVPHFTSKMHVVKYVEEKHPGMIGIYPAVGAFYTNFIEYMPPRKGDDGVLTFALPVGGDVPCQWLNPYTATGPVVAAAFTEPEKYRGTVIPVYDEVLTPKQMVDTFTQVTGIKARYHTLSKEEMVGAGAPESVADMQLHMYSYIAEFGYYAPDRNMELVHKINPHPETWAEFLKTTGFDGSQKLADIRCKLL